MDYIQFTPEQLAQARSTNLYNYMLQYHPEDVEKCGLGVIQLKAHDSLKIKQGWSGFCRHATGDHGDSIRFLREYYGLSFREAVLELLGDSYHVTSLMLTSEDINKDKQYNLIPSKKDGAYKNVMAYLCSRGISAGTISKLMDAKLLYQDVRNNAVFIHKDKSFAELKGTYTYGGKTFRQTINLTGDKSLYWSFGTGEPWKRDLAYITESAIDAVSLYELHIRKGIYDAADYCSCAGVGRVDAIAQIIADHRNSIIAVDNDAAGNRCVQQHQELKRIVPIHKDWNEDLIFLKNASNALKEGM
jgi:hypothetical protein